MSDLEKVIKGLERCKVCDMSAMASKEGTEAYLSCEYTTGLYCRQDKLINDVLDALKEYKQYLQENLIEHERELSRKQIDILLHTVEDQMKREDKLINTIKEFTEENAKLKRKRSLF